MNQRDVSVFNEIRERRKRTAEIIVIVFAAGVGINLFSTVVFDWIKDYRNISIIITSLFLTLASITLMFFLREKICQDSGFRIFLALKTHVGNKYTEKIKGYPPTMYLEKVCLDIFRNSAEDENRFKTSLLALLNTNKPDDAYLRDVITKLIYSLVVGVIKEYGEHTLTTAVLYHEKYRHLSWQFKSYILEKNILPTDLRKTGLIVGQLRLPEGVLLDFRNHTDTSHGKIVLKSSSTTLEIEPLPHWAVITKKNSRKTFDIAMRNLEKKENIILLSVPVKCNLSVKQHKVFCKETELFYDWMHGLLLALNQWLSWDEYAEGDRERLIVETYKNVTS